MRFIVRLFFAVAGLPLAGCLVSIPDVRATRPHVESPDASSSDGSDAGSDGGSDRDAGASVAVGGPCTTDGDRACAADDPEQLLVCSKNGTWDANGTCNGPTPVCAGGTCVACADGAAGCDGDTVTSCVDGSWVDQTACGASTPFCQDGACVEHCTDGTASCAGNQVRSCASGAWVGGETCTANRPTCVGGSCVGSCLGDEISCDGATPLVCTDGQWVAQAPCADTTPACYQGTCVVCSPGSLSCDGDTVRQCSGDKQWVVTSVCQDPTRACLDGACAVCSPTNNSGCPANAETCLDGACVACVPGSASCDDKIPRACDPTGNWVDGTACSRDCAAGVCETCDDQTQNGDETGVDCGGATCGRCGIGEGCKTGTDCTTGWCSGTACIPATSGCPPVPPDPNVPCTGSTTCTYGTDIRSECRDTYTCKASIWTVQQPSCASPPSCSKEIPPPTAGAACGVPNDFCVTSNQTSCTCAFCSTTPCSGTDVWQCTTPQTSPCPPLVPNVGQACTGTQMCDYGVCIASGGVLTACTGGTWTWTTPVCSI